MAAMDNPQGRILCVDRDARPPTALVEVLTRIQCARCAAGKGCGAGILGGGEKRREVVVLVPQALALREGDRVALELAPENILRAAAIVYGYPLGGAIAGAVAAYLAGAGDPGAALAALAGAAIGIVTGRARLRRAACLRQFTPVVTSRVGGA